MIEGSDQPSVVSTSETDFFTRDRRATAELIAHGVADSAEVEANPMDRTVQSEMGHEALELTAIHVVEGSETDESAEESPVETPEGVTREFHRTRQSDRNGRLATKSTTIIDKPK